MKRQHAEPARPAGAAAAAGGGAWTIDRRRLVDRLRKGLQLQTVAAGGRDRAGGVEADVERIGGHAVAPGAVVQRGHAHELAADEAAQRAVGRGAGGGRAHLHLQALALGGVHGPGAGPAAALQHEGDADPGEQRQRAAPGDDQAAVGSRRLIHHGFATLALRPFQDLELCRFG